MAEWLMAPVLKTGIAERLSGVRIPPSPPRSLLSASLSRLSAETCESSGQFEVFLTKRTTENQAGSRLPTILVGFSLPRKCEVRFRNPKRTESSNPICRGLPANHIRSREVNRIGIGPFEGLPINLSDEELDVTKPTASSNDSSPAPRVRIQEAQGYLMNQNRSREAN